MDITRNTNDLITFPHEGLGKFEVELHNATLLKCDFMANGNPENGRFTAKDWKFIEATCKSLTELLKFRDEGHGSLAAPVGIPVAPVIGEAKKPGQKFATDIEDEK